MSRRFLSKKRQLTGPRFELTALVDVIFILVLFFAVTTSFEKERKGIQLTLPTAVSVEKPKKSITIAIDRNQLLYWNGERVSEKNIAIKVKQIIEKNPNQQIILQADKETPYLRVVSVLDAIRRAGCSQVMLEAEKS